MKLRHKIRQLSWLEIGSIIRTTFVEFFQEKSFFHGAALAYYTVFALIPMMYLALISFGRFVGQKTMLELIDNLLKEQVGLSDSTGIMSFLSEVDFEKGSLLMNTIGIFALLLSSSALFASLRHSINEFYDVEVKIQERKKRLLHNLSTRLVAIVFLPIFGFIIVVTYLSETVLLSIGHKLLGVDGVIQSAFIHILENGLALLTNIILFTLIFKFLHDGVVRIKLALAGGLVTALLLYLGQLLIKFYLTNYFFASGLGVPGTLLILLSWMYYSSQIIFLGAKFIKVYADKVGEPIAFNGKTLTPKRLVKQIVVPIQWKTQRIQKTK